MQDAAKDKKKLKPSFNEQIDELKKKMEKLKKKSKAEKAKRINDERIKLHKLVTSFVSQGWPEDYEALKLNITSIIEE
jgi:excinuclease UvrABC nuclease subunit